MKRMIFCLVVCALLGSTLAAETAVFKEVRGKVEYLDAGGDWLPAKVGLSVDEGVTISTGFKSTAALAVLGSVVFVKPLTRMVITKLAQDAHGTQTNLTLLAGKVKAEVKPSSETATTSFNVKGPVATASVRGTGFEFDGANLLVNHGTVVFSNQWKVFRAVQGGEFSSIGRGVSVTPPVPVKQPEKPVITADGDASQVDQVVADNPPVVAAPGAAPKTPSTFDLGQVLNTFGDDLLLDKHITSVTDQVSEFKNDAQATVPDNNVHLAVTVH